MGYPSCKGSHFIKEASTISNMQFKAQAIAPSLLGHKGQK
jgi:hypothetical protein